MAIGAYQAGQVTVLDHSLWTTTDHEMLQSALTFVRSQIAERNRDEVPLCQEIDRLEERIGLDLTPTGGGARACWVRLDLSRLPGLSDKPKHLERNNQVVTALLRIMLQLPQVLQCTYALESAGIQVLDLSHNPISRQALEHHENFLLDERSIDESPDPDVRTDPMLIGTIDLSHTLFEGTLLDFVKVPGLVTLRLDHCGRAEIENLPRISRQDLRHEKNVKLKMLSVVGTRLGKDWAKWIEGLFPNLERVELRQKKKWCVPGVCSGDLELGTPWIFRQCGHVTSQTVMQVAVRDGVCKICDDSKPLSAERPAVPAYHFRFQLIRGDDPQRSWSVCVLDANGDPLDFENTLYFHPGCCSLFNADTVHRMLDLARAFLPEKTFPPTVEFFSNCSCPVCRLQGRESRLELIEVNPDLAVYPELFRRYALLSDLVGRLEGVTASKADDGSSDDGDESATKTSDGDT